MNYPLGAAYATPLLVVALLLVWAQHRLVGNRERFVGRGHAPASPMAANGGVTALAIAAIVFFVGLAAVLPLLALIFVAFRRAPRHRAGAGREGSASRQPPGAPDAAARRLVGVARLPGQARQRPREVNGVLARAAGDLQD